MITALDHVALAVRDVDAAADGYARLLGRSPRWIEGVGARRAWFQLSNTALELIAPDGEGPSGDLIRSVLDAQGEGVWSLNFVVEDLEAAARLLQRRGIRTDAPRPALGRRGVLCDPADTAGIQVILITPDRAPVAAPTTSEAALDALDHVVIRTANIDRAVANFGGRLGLDLRLDRANPGWGARQLFFRCGDAVVEFGASLKAPVSDAPDSFGGLAWRTGDPDGVHARLAAAGFNVSEVRPGRKPGTKVFTIRDAPAGVPTIVLSAEPAPQTARSEPA